MLDFFSYNITFPNFLIYIICCLSFVFVLISLFYPATYSIPKKNTSHGQFYNIYFIKIILTYCIIFHHILYHLGLWNRAHFCVEFFFIISGFLLIFTYKKTRTLQNFVFSKLLEFIPLIFLANLLCLFGANRIDFLKFFSGIFLFASTNFYPKHTYYPPSWFLIVLFWTSLFYFLMIRFFNIYMRHITIAFITAFSLIALSHAGNIENLNLFIPLTNGFLRGLAYMGIGYFIFIIYKHQKINNKHLYAFFSVCEFLLFFMLFLFLFVERCNVSSIWLVLTFIVLLLLFLLKQGYFSVLFEKEYWKKIAQANLFIFMTHDIILQSLLHFRLFASFSLPVRIFFIFFSCVLFGHFVYFLFSSAKYLHNKFYKNSVAH